LAKKRPSTGPEIPIRIEKIPFCGFFDPKGKLKDKAREREIKRRDSRKNDFS
jgi:hypothetical protein